jgi:hypothetical protein
MTTEDYGQTFRNILDTPLFQKIVERGRQIIQSDQNRALIEQERINNIYKQEQQ